jgi:hypothetical protein
MSVIVQGRLDPGKRNLVIIREGRKSARMEVIHVDNTKSGKHEIVKKEN